MDYTEEKTPKGYVIKIFFKNWQFLAFGKKGESLYSDSEGKTLLHRVPLIIFVGKVFKIKKNLARGYELLKIRHDTMILPYYDQTDRKTKYIFIVTDVKLDLIPVRIDSTRNINDMVKQIDSSIHPDYVIVDDSVSANDVIIIKNRYRVDNIIYIEDTQDYTLDEIHERRDGSSDININMLSENPVFLARVHLRSMNLSKLNQILLDFDLTALDTEYIINFINKTVNDDRQPLSPKNRATMDELLKSFQFYHNLLEKDEDSIRDIIQNQTNSKNLTTFRTIISKVKAMHPGSEDQLFYTEFDNLLLKKRESSMR